MLAATIAATSTGPSPLWYATRGAGTATLVLLTGSVVLGVGTAVRWETSRTPRFVTATLHRNVSLLAVILLAVHLVTTVLDPYAAITPEDAAIPFKATYRPMWLGLGVLAAELLVAVAVTSILRGRVGPRAWRLVHWSAYASWPLAVVHGLGTGSDAQAPWMLGLAAFCIVAVLLAVWRRVRTGRLATLPVRILAGAVAATSTIAILAWTAAGPLQPDWSIVSGTPVPPSSSAQATPVGPVHTGSAGFSDALVGTVSSDGAGHTQIALRDVVDPDVTLAIRPPAASETLPVVTVYRGSRLLCTAPARASATLYAVCGGTRLTITLYKDAVRLTGTLATSGPLG